MPFFKLGCETKIRYKTICYETVIFSKDPCYAGMCEIISKTSPNRRVRRFPLAKGHKVTAEVEGLTIFEIWIRSFYISVYVYLIKSYLCPIKSNLTIKNALTLCRRYYLCFSVRPSHLRDHYLVFRFECIFQTYILFQLQLFSLVKHYI